MRKSGRELFSPRSKYEVPALSPLRKSAREPLEGKDEGVYLEGHVNGMEVLDHVDGHVVGNGVILTNGVPSPIETLGGDGAKSRNGSVTQSLTHTENNSVFQSMETIGEEALASGDVSTQPLPHSEISLKGGVMTQPSDSALARVKRGSKGSTAQLTSDVTSKSCGLMPGNCIAQHQSSSDIGLRRVPVTGRYATQSADGGRYTSTVGVAAQEVRSGGGNNEKPGRKRIGGGKVSGKSPDYSHVKSRVSSRRSPKTVGSDAEKPEPKEVRMCMISCAGHRKHTWHQKLMVGFQCKSIAHTNHEFPLGVPILVWFMVCLCPGSMYVSGLACSMHIW